MNIPFQLQAGDDLTWTEIHPDLYPASAGWTMKMRLSGLAQIDLQATASGDDYVFSVTAAVSTVWGAGHYNVLAYATKGSQRVTFYTAQVEILADLAAIASDAAVDGRSDARVIYDSLTAILKTRSTKGYEMLTIAGRSVTEMKMSELVAMYHHFSRLVRDEEDAEKIKRGMKTGSMIVTRFDKAT
jgi:hypothetical protein